MTSRSLTACGLAALVALAGTARGQIIASAGFNDASGINSNPTPNSPYNVNNVLLDGQGAGEPGWFTPWQVSGARVVNAGAFEGDGAVFMQGTTQPVIAPFFADVDSRNPLSGVVHLNQSIVSARLKLFQQGAIPGRDLDTAQATLVQSKAAYDIAAQHLASLERVSNKAAIQNAEGTLQSAKGKYLGAEAQLSYTEIRSPISGVVTERPLFAGETAATGTPLITVMDTSALVAKLHIAQSQAQQLVVGGPASLTVPGIADSVKAKVSLISPALDPGSTTVEVWLRVENSKGALRAGTPVHASIQGRTIQNAVAVPREAILTTPDGSSKYVMVIAPDSTAHKKTVTVGIENADDAQVLSGISTSDMVISTGAYGLDENTKVKIGTPPSGDSDEEKPAAGTPDSGAKSSGKDADEK